MAWPTSVYNIRSRVFLCHFRTQMFKLQGNHLNRNTAYLPPTDGQTEVLNQCLETYLRCFTSDHPKKNYQNGFLGLNLGTTPTFIHRFKVHPSKHCMVKRHPPIIPYRQGTAIVSSVDDLLQPRNAILNDLRMHLLQAQQKMKNQADLKRRHEEFQIGAKYFSKSDPASSGHWLNW